MSGTLAITLREPDRTEHRLLGWNTVAPSFLRAGIPEADPEAIAHVLGSWTRMRADFEENGPDGPFRYRNTDWFAPPGLLAPEEYGLLVVDLAEGIILDGQEGHRLDRVPLYRAIADLEVLPPRWMPGAGVFAFCEGDDRYTVFVGVGSNWLMRTLSYGERAPDVLGSRAREMRAAYERQRTASPAVTASA